MNIHEYQAKKLLAEFGVAVPQAAVADTPEQAAAAAAELGGPVWAVKAQIHAGGRGKGGGVRVVKSQQAVADAANDILGMQLVTPQTGADGKKVRKIYIENGCDIMRELYVGMLIDRAHGCITLIASTAGGMDIEEVAAKTPDKIIKFMIDICKGLQSHQCRRISFALGLNPKQARACEKLLKGVYKAFTELDASLVEINPLVVTKDDEILALDAKMNFDDNALMRQPQVADLRDPYEEDPAELAAAEQGLNYIKLDGAIGCMVNGAGLAMATMDIIKLHGSAPANFLDVGGSAPAERVTAAFKIILSDKNVKSILVNIFGGIMKCDIIAKGIVAAAKQVHLQVPLVVRLEGTNVEKGKKILADSGLPIVSADNLADAAEKAVVATRGN